MEFEAILFVLFLQQHDAVLKQEDVKLYRLETAKVAQLEGQSAVENQFVRCEVQILWEKESLNEGSFVFV